MSDRRGRGEGSIYVRRRSARDGTTIVRYCAQVSAGWDEGQRIRKTITGATKAEVVAKKRALEATLSQAAKVRKADRSTVGSFLQRWLNDVARRNVQASTYLSYETTLRLHVIPYIGTRRLDALDPIDIQELLNGLDKAGASARTLRKAYAVLRRALGQAAKLDLIRRNPCERIDPPTYEPARMRPLNEMQARALLAAAEGDRLWALYVLAITCGLRQSELLGLKWADVDYAAKTLSVRRMLRDLNGKLGLVERTKTGGGRVIRLSQEAIRALREHRKELLQEGLAASELVFCDTAGGFVRKPNLLRRSFWPLLEAAKVPKIRFHDLRHTCATLLLSKGVHPKIVSEMLGHKKISITLDLYSHVLPSMQEPAAQAMDSIFSS